MGQWRPMGQRNLNEMQHFVVEQRSCQSLLKVIEFAAKKHYPSKLTHLNIHKLTLFAASRSIHISPRVCMYICRVFAVHAKGHLICFGPFNQLFCRHIQHIKSIPQWTPCVFHVLAELTKANVPVCEQLTNVRWQYTALGQVSTSNDTCVRKPARLSKRNAAFWRMKGCFEHLSFSISRRFRLKNETVDAEKQPAKNLQKCFVFQRPCFISPAGLSLLPLYSNRSPQYPPRTRSKHPITAAWQIYLVHSSNVVFDWLFCP